MHNSAMFPQPFPVKLNDADISDEMREVALKRTAEVLRKIEEVRKGLELPVEHLPLVIETYGTTVAALLVEKEREELAKHTKRVPLTMRSENRDYQPVKIPRSQNSEVVVRPQTMSFRPEDIAIHGDRSRWVVHDILVGNRSQFVSRAIPPAPGTEFGPGGILEHMRLDTCQTAMDLRLVVEYVGPEEDGEVFEATVVGTSVIY